MVPSREVWFMKNFVAIKLMKGNMSNELKILSQVHQGNVVSSQYCISQIYSFFYS
jgi:hypothetical protein